MEYEEKLALIDKALEDYDIEIKQMKGGLLLTDLLYNMEEED